MSDMVYTLLVVFSLNSIYALGGGRSGVQGSYFGVHRGIASICGRELVFRVLILRRYRFSLLQICSVSWWWRRVRVCVEFSLVLICFCLRRLSPWWLELLTSCVMRLGVSSQLWLYFRSKERMLSLPGGCGVANWVGSCVYSSLVLGWNCRIWQRKILLWLLLSFCSSSSLSRSSLCSSHFACDFKSSSDSLFCYYLPLQGQVVV